MSTSSEASIPFHGATLRAKQMDGVTWVALKPICEHLGINWATQLQKLRSDDRFSCRDIPMTAADGKTYLMACLYQDELLGWLYTINPNKVKADARPLLIAYQKETTRAINVYWETRLAPTPTEGELYLRTGKVLYSRRCKVCNSALAPEIDALLDDPEVSYDDVVAWAAERGLAISKAGLSRHNAAHRVPDAAPRSLAEHPEIAARIMLAKLTDIAQRRSLEGLSDREVVKYQTSLAVSLSRGMHASTSRALPPVAELPE